jgi:hypothetical protein
MIAISGHVGPGADDPLGEDHALVVDGVFSKTIG